MDPRDNLGELGAQDELDIIDHMGSVHLDGVDGADFDIPTPGARPYDGCSNFEAGLEEVNLNWEQLEGAEEITMQLPRRSRSRGRASRQSAKTISPSEANGPRLSAKNQCASAARGDFGGGKATLNLQRENLSDEDVAGFVAPMLRSPSCRLVTLILTRNRVTDAGAASLAEALRDAQGGGRGVLARLDLNQNDIGDAGAVALLAAIGGSRVTHLDLAWNGEEGGEGGRVFWARHGKVGNGEEIRKNLPGLQRYRFPLLPTPFSGPFSLSLLF
jgi:hypothetical protein